MKSRWQRPLVFAIIILGLIGVITKIVTNPVGVLTFIIIVGALIGLGIFLYRRFLNKQFGSEMDAYRKAARKSRKRHKGKAPKTASHLKLIRTRAKQKSHLLNHTRSRNAEHLKVIEGKKRKKKNRALF